MLYIIEMIEMTRYEKNKIYQLKYIQRHRAEYNTYHRKYYTWKSISKIFFNILI